MKEISVLCDFVEFVHENYRQQEIEPTMLQCV